MRTPALKLLESYTRISNLRKDILLTFISQVVILICAFIITKLVSNLYTVEEFGQYNVIKRSSSVLTFVMLGGMGITLPRYLPIYLGKRQFRNIIDLQNIAIIYIILISLIIVFTGVLFSNFLIEPLTGSNNINLYKLLFFYSFSLTTSSLLFAYFRGLNDFSKYCMSQVMIQVALITSIIFISKQSLSVLFFSWSIIGLFITLLFFLTETIKKRLILIRDFNYQRIKKHAKSIIGYSLPRLIGDFFLFSFSAFPVVYLSSKQTMIDVAYFSVGLTILSMATPLFSFLGVMLLPYVSSAIAKGTINEANHFINKMQLLYFFASIFIAVLFWMFMPTIIKLFFSVKYLETLELSQLIVLAVIPQAFYLLYRNPIDAASVIPYNTIILMISFTVLAVSFFYSSELSEYAYSFLFASFIQGGASLITWIILKKKLTNNPYEK